jgi:hypothetical protein
MENTSTRPEILIITLQFLGGRFLKQSSFVAKVTIDIVIRSATIRLWGYGSNQPTYADFVWMGIGMLPRQQIGQAGSAFNHSNANLVGLDQRNSIPGQVADDIFIPSDWICWSMHAGVV